MTTREVARPEDFDPFAEGDAHSAQPPPTPIIYGFGAIGERGFYNKLSEESVDVLVGIPVMTRIRRAHWIGEYPDSTIDCESEDGVLGSNYGSCEGCEFAVWGREDGKTIPPSCKEYRRILIWLTEDGEMITDQEMQLAILNVPSVSIRQVDAYRTSRRQQGSRDFATVTGFTRRKEETKNKMEVYRLHLEAKATLDRKDPVVAQIVAAMPDLAELMQTSVGEAAAEVDDAEGTFTGPPAGAYPADQVQKEEEECRICGAEFVTYTPGLVPLCKEHAERFSTLTELADMEEEAALTKLEAQHTDLPF